MQWSDEGSGAVNTVRTTGIYCRAGCAGRPNPENTMRMRSPVEAEAAGYRACLRCRPDRLPLVSRSAATDPVVAHALILIGDGFLDRHDESELGRAVGVSGRHLRRLFADSVGASPAQVAMSRRAHFARAMLDETELSVTDIAFAAGFGSVRRMNEVVQSVFRSSPTELRAARRNHGDRTSIDGGLTLTLRAHRAIDAERWHRWLAPTLIPGVETLSYGMYRRSTNVCGHGGAIEIRIAGPHAVEVTAHLPSVAGLIDEIHRCRRLLGLDDIDAGPAQAWTPYEAAVRDLAGASSTLAEFVRCRGRPIAGLDGITHEFPAPHDLCAAPDRWCDHEVCAAATDLAERHVAVPQ